MGSKKKPHGDDQPVTVRKRRKPHFFKILLGDFHHRLRIPPTFLKHISDESSDRVILSVPDGKTSWSVSLDRTINGTFLSSGWQSFVSDCALEEYEFLVFCYEGDMQFTVLLFDETACQKNVVMLMETENDSKCYEGIGNPERPANDSVDADLSLPPSEPKSQLNELMKEGKCVTFSKVRDCVKTEIEDCSENKAEYDVAASSVPSPKKKYIKQRKLEAEKAADSFCSEFPYFVRRLVECNVSKSFTLRIPAKFSREHLPDKRTKIVLQDPTGRAWTVVCIPGSTCMISGGWTAFVRGNNLKVGDFCAFEMVGPVELRVTIFRVKGNTRLAKK